MARHSLEYSPMTNTRPVIEPQKAPLRLFLRYFQPLATPDALHPFVVDLPALMSKQRGAASTAVVPAPGKPAAPRLSASAARGEPPAGVVRGLVFYLQGFLEDRFVQCLFSDELLQAGILTLQVLELPGLGYLHATVFLPPAVVALLGDPQLPAHLAGRLAACELDLGFS